MTHFVNLKIHFILFNSLEKVKVGISSISSNWGIIMLKKVIKQLNFLLKQFLIKALYSGFNLLNHTKSIYYNVQVHINF